MDAELERGYIGLTDPDWHSFLCMQSRVDEVNFWQPHGNRKFRAIRPGQPFFFKLRAPHKAIAGFGFFERYEALPAWLAWECFKEMNGASDFESMVDRILRLRGDDSSRTGDFTIGCVMVAAPVFFSREEWVAPPGDWPPTGIQQGKTYRLDRGEGLRVWRECLERATRESRYWNVEPDPDLQAGDGARYGPAAAVRPRLGQGLFSISVRDAYHEACAVTQEHSAPVLEAAHIIPYGCGGEHRVDNGLLLRSDLHRLFDRGYVTVTPDYVFRVGESLRADFQNGRSYYGLHERSIGVPKRMDWQPNREYLDWHQHEVFRG